MHTSGKHDLEFTYGDSVSYAHNNAADPSLVANVTIHSSNTNAFFAKLDDVINITLDTNVQIHNATLDILNMYVDMNVTNKTAFTNVTVLSNAPNGPIIFNITVYKNSQTCSVHITDVTQDAALQQCLFANEDLIDDESNPRLHEVM